MDGEAEGFDDCEGLVRGGGWGLCGRKRVLQGVGIRFKSTTYRLSNSSTYVRLILNSLWLWLLWLGRAPQTAAALP